MTTNRRVTDEEWRAVFHEERLTFSTRYWFVDDDP